MSHTDRRMTTIQVSSSDKYLLSREDILRNTTPGPSGIQRSSESPEIQQPVLIQPLWPLNRGPAFPKLEACIPYISDDDQAAITTWFQQNIPAILQEWDQPVRPTFELPDLPREPDPIPPYWIRMAEELPRSRPRHPELRDALLFPTTDEPNLVLFPTRPRQYGVWPEEDSDTDSDDSEPLS